MLSTQSPPNSTSVKGSLTPSASSPQIKLRDYQKKFIRDVYREIRNQRKRILGVAPTGAGKTIISAKIVKDAVSRGRRVLFVVHRDILVQQTSEKFAFFGLECGFIKSGWQENQQALVQIASVQTMESRSWWRNWPVELVILDECHLTAFSTIIQEMREQVHQNALYLGITATPWRLKSTEGMGDIFTALVCAPLPSTLINQGFLVKPAYFGSDLAEDAQIEIDEEGDFNEKKLVIAYDHPEMIQEGLKQWQRLAYGRRTIIFAVNVTHSQHICEAFTKAGISSAHVDGRTFMKSEVRSQKSEVAIRAAMRFKEQYGHFPPLAWGNHAIFGQPPPSLAMQQYRQHLSAIASRLEKESDWIERYFKMEFSS